MPRSKSILFRLARVAAFFAILLLVYWVWEPGTDVRDGRHDRGHNGLWLAHGWLGADEWFVKNGKQNQLSNYRSSEALQNLAALCAQNHLSDLFPHLCPCDVTGNLPPVDNAQVERFLDVLPGCRVFPWVGGPSQMCARYAEADWRQTFCASIRTLLEAHPRLAGIHLNIEPLPSGDAAFLTLLEDIRRALPPGKLLSIAAYPPPTRWHPFPSVHWDEAYFREVARRSDQLAMMMYDTALTRPKLYRKLMSDWTVEILTWSEGKPVLLGLAAYDDANTGYHDPTTESLLNGLLGIHAGLERAPLPGNYQGAALYSHWEMDDGEWATWRERFLAPRP